MQLTELRDSVASGEVCDDLLEEPDCLAEMEYTYSVFRFRHTWGTVYDVTITNLADAYDREAAMAMVPRDHVFLDCEDTDTTGVGHNGVVTEVTHRLLATYGDASLPR